MKIEEIIQLMEAAQATDFDTLTIKEGEFCLKLRRNQQQPVVAVRPSVEVVASSVQQPQQALPQAVPEQAAQQESSPQEGNAPGSKSLTSPLVGIYHELTGGKAVKIGDKLKKGDVVCMIEAMKLMNEIQMPEDGEIVWIAVEEGSTVEYEQTLFNYK